MCPRVRPFGLTVSKRSFIFLKKIAIPNGINGNVLPFENSLVNGIFFTILLKNTFCNPRALRSIMVLEICIANLQKKAQILYLVGDGRHEN